MVSSFVDCLHSNKNRFADILPIKNWQNKACSIDLSINNPIFKQINSTVISEFDTYLQSVLKAKESIIAFGGYGEHRNLYQSDLFSIIDNPRCIHLGIDLWTDAQTPICLPLEGTVHSFANNNNHLDYGPTIIIEHQLDDHIFYTLYGHLTKTSLDNLWVGKSINRGEQFAWIGTETENGGWSPHLHFQIITDLLGNKGDFIGVATQQEAKRFLDICPNPKYMLGL